MKLLIEKSIERGNRRANQKEDMKLPPPRTVMSIFRSTSKVFASMGRDSYELRDSWIVDSGADIHICNDRSRFLSYEPADDHWAHFGTTMVQILGYGRIDVCATECHTSILSTFQIKRKGFYMNQRTNVIEDREGRPICRTEEKFNLEVIEYNPIPAATIFAMKRYSARPHQSEATSERWHQRLAHLGDEAVLHLEESAIGAKVTSCQRSIVPNRPFRSNRANASP
jgi:hypothetical protein